MDNKNTKRVENTVSAIVEKSRQTGSHNLHITEQIENHINTEREKCRNDFGYFCEKYLKVSLVPARQYLMERL